MVSGLKERGIFLLNTIWERDKLLANIPNEIKRELAMKNANSTSSTQQELAKSLEIGRIR